MKIQKNKMLGGGGVDSTLSTSNNNNNQNFCIKQNRTYKQTHNDKNKKREINTKEETARIATVDFARLNRANNGDNMNILKNNANLKTKTTKLLIGLHIGFLLICAIFLSFTLSMLSDSKTATGTVTFALTDSPELSMNLYYYSGAEHKTYLGTTSGAEITNLTDVLRINVAQDSSLEISVRFASNTITIPSNFELKTNNNVTLNLISNTNGTATFKATSVVANDYVVLDKLMSGIYLNSAINNQTYELLITSQAGNSVPATAKLSGIYSNVVGQHTVNFTLNENYGVITPSSITVPYGTTYSSSGNIMTFVYNGLTVETVTATPLSATVQYTYSFASWGTPTGTITGDTTIQVNFSQKVREYTVTFYNEDGTIVLGTDTVAYGVTAEYTGTTPTKDGYKFDGWVTEIGGSTPANLTYIVSNQNVYASFVETQYRTLTISGSNFSGTVGTNTTTGENIIKGVNNVRVGNSIRLWVGLYKTFDVTEGLDYQKESACGGFYMVFTMPDFDVSINSESSSSMACCVYEDTLITLADGTTKRADEIEIGDKIQSYNFETGKIEIDTISNIIQKTRIELITINFKDGTSIKLTNDHPLYTELGWKCYDKEKGEASYIDLGIVGEFEAGDKLFSISKYFDKEVVSIEYEEDKTNGYNTYQFGVEKNSNYFANGVLSSAL